MIITGILYELQVKLKHIYSQPNPPKMQECIEIYQLP